MIVVISGSRSIKSLPTEAITRIDKIMELGANILIGDASGVDAAVGEYLKSKGYNAVTIYHVGSCPWNNAGYPTVKVSGSYTDRDKKMCSLANYGLAIIKNNSKGTRANIQRVPKTRVIVVE